MNAFDVAIAFVFVISTLIGLYRGFIRETLSLLGWVLAFWLAFTFAESFSPLFSPYLSSPSLRTAASFLVLFLVSVIVFSLIAFLLGRLLAGPAIQGTDRLLGGLFGVLRALVIVAAFMLAAGLTSMPSARWWQESLFADRMEPVVAVMRELLPEDIARQFQSSL